LEAITEEPVDKALTDIGRAGDRCGQRLGDLLEALASIDIRNIASRRRHS